jgi:hypothetical protein
MASLLVETGLKIMGLESPKVAQRESEFTQYGQTKMNAKGRRRMISRMGVNGERISRKG